MAKQSFSLHCTKLSQISGLDMAKLPRTRVRPFNYLFFIGLLQNLQREVGMVDNESRGCVYTPSKHLCFCNSKIQNKDVGMGYIGNLMFLNFS